MTERRKFIFKIAGCALLLWICVFATGQVAPSNFTESWAVHYADSLMQRWPSMNNLVSSWCYEAGIVMQGIQQIYLLTGDIKYLTYIQKFVDSHVGSTGSVSFSASTLDDYLSARQLLFLFEQTGQQKYRLAAERFRSAVSGISRNSAGGFWHKSKYPNQMWCDGQYMLLPFLIHYGALIGDQEYAVQETHFQMTLMASHAQDLSSGLLYHGWDASQSASWANSATGLSPEFWGRGLGWYAMAMVDILDYFPQADPRYADILRILQDLVPGLANVQDPATGLWFQVLDKGSQTGNWLESSCSAMFVYTLHKAARLGYVNAAYLNVAQQGFAGLIANKINVDSSGYITLKDIVNGMGVQRSFSGYVNQGRLTNSPHGLGAFLLAATEILKTPGTPVVTPPLLPTLTPGATPTATPLPAFTPVLTATPLFTFTPVPTATPLSTFTPVPTATLLPTFTLVPTATPLSTFTPVPTAISTVSPVPTATPRRYPYHTPRKSPTPSPTPQVTPPPPKHIKGDVNLDGAVTIVDALFIAQYSVGLPIPIFNTVTADVDCNGSINIIDALLIAQSTVGLLEIAENCG